MPESEVSANRLGLNRRGATLRHPVHSAPQIAARPDGFPEEFWDAEKGVVKFDALTPKLQEHAASQAGLIQKPEDIDWSLPTDLDPDNKDFVFEVNKDDPMVAALAPELVGLPQAKVSSLVAAMARFQLGQAKEARDLIKAEEGKLGEKFMERITGAQAFVESIVGKEKAAAFRNTWVTAAQVEVMEAIAKHAAGPTPARADPQGETQESKGRTFYAGMAGGDKG